jgi:hypothetical protein
VEEKAGPVGAVHLRTSGGTLNSLFEKNNDCDLWDIFTILLDFFSPAQK